MKGRKLYLIANLNRSQRPSIARLKNLIRNGVDMLQLRCKGVSDNLFLQYALRLRRLCRLSNVPFIINDRIDIALASDADGLHVGQEDIPPLLARKILGADKIIGLSTHSCKQIDRALKLKGIDYIAIGPIFKTATKPSLKPIGLGPIRHILKKRVGLPFFAIGGIAHTNIDNLLKAGAEKVAIASAILNSKAPLKATGRFKKRLNDTD